mmetsp:Transcript_18052/g.60872  ORF Transcript_18052/g.60872 Transcript_18052/m.60872 type:complete len:405 (-) Transcript_18052:3871-5085(-)
MSNYNRRAILEGGFDGAWSLCVAAAALGLVVPGQAERFELEHVCDVTLDDVAVFEFKGHRLVRRHGGPRHLQAKLAAGPLGRLRLVERLREDVCGDCPVPRVRGRCRRTGLALRSLDRRCQTATARRFADDGSVRQKEPLREEDGVADGHVAVAIDGELLGHFFRRKRRRQSGRRDLAELRRLRGVAAAVERAHAEAVRAPRLQLGNAHRRLPALVGDLPFARGGDCVDVARLERARGRGDSGEKVVLRKGGPVVQRVHQSSLESILGGPAGGRVPPEHDGRRLAPDDGWGRRRGWGGPDLAGLRELGVRPRADEAQRELVHRVRLEAVDLGLPRRPSVRRDAALAALPALQHVRHGVGLPPRRKIARLDRVARGAAELVPDRPHRNRVHGVRPVRAQPRQHVG